ncbi:Hypothetical protein ORPV_906 [Orpheovirus IHUMI-LCC2]|uniref:Uncharacterized protein n=1 Tax=Orpheovirus IHUMI-LCC2 TaxID=2023057 RepID=A0A2I2L5N6_9VIRU|nr:Hypothetical protein ORPV_906 [Orpheovirus IHUMI-LCC2]SNW62810.1 Hypothetical protein ORPV_906 [Orpheovirus IHUMI-LCC2]
METIIPEWQKRLADASGVPVEYWNLPENELKEKLKWHNTILSIPPLTESQLIMKEDKSDEGEEC